MWLNVFLQKWTSTFYRGLLGAVSKTRVEGWGHGSASFLLASQVWWRAWVLISESKLKKKCELRPHFPGPRGGGRNRRFTHGGFLASSPSWELIGELQVQGEILSQKISQIWLRGMPTPFTHVCARATHVTSTYLADGELPSASTGTTTEHRGRCSFSQLPPQRLPFIFHDLGENPIQLGRRCA